MAQAACWHRIFRRIGTSCRGWPQDRGPEAHDFLFSSTDEHRGGYPSLAAAVAASAFHRSQGSWNRLFFGEKRWRRPTCKSGATPSNISILFLSGVGAARRWDLEFDGCPGATRNDSKLCGLPSGASRRSSPKGKVAPETTLRWARYCGLASGVTPIPRIPAPTHQFPPPESSREASTDHELCFAGPQHGTKAQNHRSRKNASVFSLLLLPKGTPCRKYTPFRLGCLKVCSSAVEPPWARGLHLGVCEISQQFQWVVAANCRSTRRR
jgi:hypothetical protein